MPYINLNKVNLYYEEVGINEPVIFLHNAFSRGIIAFSTQIGMLQSKYRCGHGPHLITEKPVEVAKIIDKFLKEATITGER